MFRRRRRGWWRLRGSSEAAGYQDVADGERGAATAVDELARVHAPGVTDGERGAATAVVLVVELSRDCN